MRRLKLLGGLGCIAIGFFMLLGFYRSGLPNGSRAFKLFTVLVSAGLPMASGAGLLYSYHRSEIDRYKKALDWTLGKTEHRDRALQAEIIRLAIDRGGQLTVVEVIAELGLDPTVATQQLTALTHHQLAELEITDSGLLVYVFQDAKNLPEKFESRRMSH